MDSVDHLFERILESYNLNVIVLICLAFVTATRLRAGNRCIILGFIQHSLVPDIVANLISSEQINDYYVTVHKEHRIWWDIHI